MSLESAKRFIKNIQEDEEFRNKFEQVTDNEGRLQILKDGGYEFTKSEIREAVQGELSDEDLEGVAGGVVASGTAIIGGAIITGVCIIIAD